MTGARPRPRALDLPRDEGGLATSEAAAERLETRLTAFVADRVEKADADGVVVRLDGGIDSTVAAAMAVDALGADSVTGLVMPAHLTDEASARDAEAVASLLGVEHHRLQLQPVVGAFQEVIGTAGEPADDLVAMENAVERFKMVCAYYVANARRRLVAGSVDRTDHLLGTPAKHGHSGVDLSLLADVYRTEVRALARHVDVPEDILDRPDPGREYAEGAGFERLDVDPRTLDSVLRLSVDEGLDAATVADRIGVEPALVRRVERWCAAASHKRRRPPSPSTVT